MHLSFLFREAACEDGGAGQGLPWALDQLSPAPQQRGSRPLKAGVPGAVGLLLPSTHISLQISEKETQVLVLCHSGFASLTYIDLFPGQTQHLGNQQHFASRILE